MEVKPGYKLTEVGVIPDDWEVKQLGELAKLKNGYSFSSSTYTPIGQFKIVTIANVQDGYMDAAASNKIGALPRDLQPHHRLQHSDILISMTGNVGRVCHVTEDDCLLNQRVGKLVPSAVDGNFLFLLLSQRAFLAAMAGKAKGGAQGNLSRADIIEYPFPVSLSLAEQRAIANALSDVNALLDGLERLIAKKRDLKQAAMQQLLTGQTRLPGFSGEWVVRRLGEVVQIQKGQLITSSTLLSGDVPVIAGGRQPAYFHATANRYGRTITISASGASAGYVALYEGPIFASDCSTISESSSYCLDFIFYQLLCKQQAIYKAQTGGAQPHIHAKDLCPIQFSFPTVAEQGAIAAVLCDMDAELSALQARRDKTRDLKQAMMQELLTGRTRLL
jgi:type I restriction enzyme S subunit